MTCSPLQIKMVRVLLVLVIAGLALVSCTELQGSYNFTHIDIRDDVY